MKIFRYSVAGLLIALICVHQAGFAVDPMLAPIAAKNLNGDDVAFPTGSNTLLLVGFERQQQDDIDGWINGLDLAHSGFTWYELPVIDDPGAVLRWIITRGMRNGIADSDRRAHVVTLFVDRQMFLKSLEISDASSCYAILIDPDGKILTTVFGDYDPEKSRKILYLMKKDTTFD